MTRNASSGLSLVSVVFALVLIPIAAHFAWDAVDPDGPDSPAPGDLQVALIRAGLDPDALAAAGLTTGEATEVVEAFAVVMASEPGKLSDADTAYASARVKTDSLRRKVRSGLASAQEVQDLAASKASLETAETSRAQTLDAWFAAGTEPLPAGKAQALSTIRGNRDWNLPIEFLTVDRTEQEWVDVRKALNNERICAKYDDPPDAAHQSALASWRSAPACSSAKSNCDANIDGIKTAWDAATGK